MNLSNETIKSIKDDVRKELINEGYTKPQPIETTPKTLDFYVNKKWFIRTVTYHMVGYCTGIIRDGNHVDLIFDNASWIPCSSIFSEFIKDGKLDEVEPVGEMFVNAASIVDKFPWNHELPNERQ